MNDAERRAANRRRVAASLADGHVPPGLTGAEIVSLARLTPAGSADRGRTEYEGGWRHKEADLNSASKPRARSRDEPG